LKGIDQGSSSITEYDVLVAEKHIENCIKILDVIWPENEKAIFDFFFRNSLDRITKHVASKDIEHLKLNDIYEFLSLVDVIADHLATHNIEKDFLIMCDLVHRIFFMKVITNKLLALERIDSGDVNSYEWLSEKQASTDIIGKYDSFNYYNLYYKRKFNEISSNTAESITSDRDPQKTNLPELSKSESCYIATMVYGSCDSPEVLVLRRYRDKYLLTKSWGRLLVNFYYRVSPSVVRKVKKHCYINKVLSFLLGRIVVGLEHNMDFK